MDGQDDPMKTAKLKAMRDPKLLPWNYCCHRVNITD